MLIKFLCVRPVLCVCTCARARDLTVGGGEEMARSGVGRRKWAQVGHIGRNDPSRPSRGTDSDSKVKARRSAHNPITSNCRSTPLSLSLSLSLLSCIPNILCYTNCCPISAKREFLSQPDRRSYVLSLSFSLSMFILLVNSFPVLSLHIICNFVSSQFIHYMLILSHLFSSVNQ